MKKLLSLLLVLALCLSLFPAAAFAEEPVGAGAPVGPADDADEPVGADAPVGPSDDAEEPVGAGAPDGPSDDPDEPVGAGVLDGPSDDPEEPVGADAPVGLSDDPDALPEEPVGDEPDAVTASGSCGDNLTWTLENGVLTISGTGAIGWSNSDRAPWYTYHESITAIVLPEGLTSICPNSFRDCNYVSQVMIPSGVTSIGNQAFYGCGGLTNVTIPGNVTSIGAGAFADCGSLESILVDSGNPAYTTKDGIIYSKDMKTLVQCPGGKTGSVTIPSGVMIIMECAFYGCSSLTSLTIPSSVTSIGDSAFRFCSSLTSVTIPSSVTSIGDYAFRDCSSMTSVIILEGVTIIGKCAFYDCSSLTSLTIPSSVTSIGDSAFNGCSSLTSVTISSGVTSIGGNAFNGCSSLTSVTIPSSVTSIGDYAFCNCSSLTSVTIPGSVTNIGSGSFVGCSGLKTAGPIGGGYNIEFGWIDEIPSQAFSRADNLICVTIPASITVVGIGAFQGCSRLTTVLFLGDAPSISSNAFAYYYRYPTYYYVNATAFYSLDNETWTADKLVSYGAQSLTWVGCHGEAKAFTVSYDANGGTNAPSTQYKGNGVDLAITTTRPTRSSENRSFTVTLDPNGGWTDNSTTISSSCRVYFSFLNWNTKRDGSGTAYESGANYTQDEDVTLYAQWAESVDSYVWLPTASREGYTFLGWARDPEAVEPDYPRWSSYNGSEDVTLYAVWKIHVYPVQYIVGSKATNAPEAQEKTYNVDLVLSDTIPELEGYTFLGWSLYNNGAPEYQPGDTYTGNGTGADDLGNEFPITFYAVWQAKTYLIYYKDNGGEDSPAPQIKTHGVALTLSEEIPTRSGYTFLGWATNRKASEPEYQPGDRFTANANTVLYAVWEKVVPATESKIIVDGCSAGNGQEIQIPVRLEKNPGVVSIEISVLYDDTILEWTGVTEGSYGGTFLGEVGDSLTWYAEDAAVNETKDDVFVILSFRVKNSAPAGTTQISVSYEEDNIYNADEVNQPFLIVPGEIEILSHTPGDINGDGQVNNKDVTRLQRYLKGQSVEVVEAALDVNGDGKINNKDATRLQRYLKYGDVDIH